MQRCRLGFLACGWLADEGYRRTRTGDEGRVYRRRESGRTASGDGDDTNRSASMYAAVGCAEAVAKFRSTEITDGEGVVAMRGLWFRNEKLKPRLALVEVFEAEASRATDKVLQDRPRQGSLPLS
jgi:hypothetical protein